VKTGSTKIAYGDLAGHAYVDMYHCVSL